MKSNPVIKIEYSGKEPASSRANYKKLDRIVDPGFPVDPMGYWNPANVGKIVQVPTENGHITMKGVDQPLWGMDEYGNTQYQMPGQEYHYPGKFITEYPIAQNGAQVEERSLKNVASQFIPVYETYLDYKNIASGIKTGNKNDMYNGILGLTSPIAGKALGSTVDYITEKTLGKKEADYNQKKREDIVNMSQHDREQLFLKYGHKGYDAWAKEGFPKLNYGGWLDFMQDGGSRTDIYTDKVLFDKAYKAEQDSAKLYEKYIKKIDGKKKTYFEKPHIKPILTETGKIKNGLPVLKTILESNLKDYENDKIKPIGIQWVNERFTGTIGYDENGNSIGDGTQAGYAKYKKPVVHNEYLPPKENPPLKQTSKLIPSSDTIRHWNFNGANPVMEYYDKSNKLVKKEYYDKAGKKINPYIPEYTVPVSKDKLVTKQEGGIKKDPPIDFESYRRTTSNTNPKSHIEAQEQLDHPNKKQDLTGYYREKAYQAKDQGTFKTYVPQGNISKALEMISNPATAIKNYVATGRVPDHFSQDASEDMLSPTSVLNMGYQGLTGIGRVASMTNAGYNVPKDLVESNYLSAGMNALDVLPGMPNLPKVKVKDIHKYNPWAFKPNPEAYYRGIGKSGLDDALEKGILRPPVNTPYGKDRLYMTGTFGETNMYNKDLPKYKGDPFGEADDWIEILPEDSKRYVAEIPKNKTNFVIENDIANTNSGYSTIFPKLSDVKLYKEHWLKGYKEVPKAKSLQKEQDGGWLDEEEFRRGGQKGLKKFTSKNIATSVNDIMMRNETLFGKVGRRRYKPGLKFENGGGWLDNII